MDTKQWKGNLRINPARILPDSVSRELLSRAAEIIATQKLSERQSELVAQALFQGAAIAAREMSLC